MIYCQYFTSSCIYESAKPKDGVTACYLSKGHQVTTRNPPKLEKKKRSLIFICFFVSCFGGQQRQTTLRGCWTMILPSTWSSGRDSAFLKRSTNMTWTTICPLLTCRLTAGNVSDYLFLRGILSWGHMWTYQQWTMVCCIYCHTVLSFCCCCFAKGLRIEDVVVKLLEANLWFCINKIDLFWK